MIETVNFVDIVKKSNYSEKSYDDPNVLIT